MVVITAYVCQDCDWTPLMVVPVQAETVVIDKRCKCGKRMIQIKTEISEVGV